MWIPGGGELYKQIRSVVDRYQEMNPGVVVKITTVPAHESNDKLFVTTAGGSPPDITYTVGFQVPEWAETGLLQPLDDLILRYDVESSAFFSAAWQRGVYRGKVWALPQVVDPNFAVAVNKDLLDASGVGTYPESIADLDVLNRKLVRYDSDNNPTQIAMHAWSIYGGGNTFRTWAHAFGADLVDVENQKVTLDQPSIVEALTWVKEQHDFYGGVIPAGGFGGGRAAFAPLVTNNAKYYIDQGNFEIEMTRMPRAPGVPVGVEWLGGWSVAIPKNAPHPQEAFELLRWLNATADGTYAYSNPQAQDTHRMYQCPCQKGETLHVSAYPQGTGA